MAGISPLVIGLTVVAMGTSVPELTVSLRAALTGQADLTLGNVVGSNIANVLLILGLAAVAAPLLVAARVHQREVPTMIGVSLLLWLLAADGAISQLDGLVLLGLLVVFLGVTMVTATQAARQLPLESPSMNQDAVQTARRLMLLALLLVLGATTGCTSQSPSVPLQRSEGHKEVNGTSFYYQTIGTGTPIFVLHGGPGGSHRYFLPHLEPLAETHQLILFDQRGTGQSDGNLDMRAVSIGQFVEDIDALRAAFGFERISVMGHSWGAVLALFYAFEHQERLDRLILVAPRPLTNAFIVEQGNIVRQRFQGLSPVEQQTLRTTCERPMAELSEAEAVDCVTLAARLDFFDPSKALQVDWSDDPSTLKNRGTVESLLTASFNRLQSGVEAGLVAIQVPTLIVHGEYDSIPVPSVEYLYRHIAGSQLVVLPESGHFPFVEQPEGFAAVVRTFLQPGVAHDDGNLGAGRRRFTELVAV